MKEGLIIVETFLLHLLLFNSLDMSSSKEIIKWASGELHSILGYSDNNLAEYIVSLAKKAKNSNDLLTKLKENDLEESSNLISFSKRLYSTVHNKNKEVSTSHTSHTSSSSHTTKLSNAELLKQSQSYELVGMEDTTIDKLTATNTTNTTTSDITAVKKDKKESKKASIRRKHDIDDNDEDQDNTQIYKKIKHKTTSSIESSRHNSDPSHPTTTTDPDIDPIKQAQLDADIAERDEFVARLLDREEQRTKKLAEPQGLTVEQVKELATKGVLSTTGTHYYYLFLYLFLYWPNHIQTTSFSTSLTIGGGGGGGGDSKQTIEMLRELSRQTYLTKREEKELKLLEQSLKDEEYLFENVPLTTEEIKRKELNQNILKMARNKNRFNYNDIDDGFKLLEGYEDPETGLIDRTKRDAVLTARYEEEEVILSEQEQWEDQQVSMSNVHFGAKDKLIQHKKDDYDYVMEDQIDFISSQILKGTIRKEPPPTTSTTTDGTSTDAPTGEAHPSLDPRTLAEQLAESEKHMTAHEKILALRKRLPVYPYREEFLEAVRENKVLIIVGETGSGRYIMRVYSVYRV